MKLLKDKILKDGIVIEPNILKVDNFLNHQIDVSLMNEMGKEFARRFKNENINKIVTIEASGIAIAALTSQYFNNIPVVFAKKQASKITDDTSYFAEVFSFTKGISSTIRISKKYLNEEDRVLIIDDFLANGEAALGLASLIKESGATVIGVGIAIEKGFQDGRSKINAQGIKVESLAIIDKFEDGKVILK